MNLDALKRLHDAAVELGGAECNDSCVFNTGGGALDQVKSATRVRARALAFLHQLSQDIPG
jgi:hypothetical protein